MMSQSKEMRDRIQALYDRVRQDGFLRQEGSYTQSDVSFVLRVMQDEMLDRSEAEQKLKEVKDALAECLKVKAGPEADKTRLAAHELAANCSYCHGKGGIWPAGKGVWLSCPKCEEARKLVWTYPRLGQKEVDWKTIGSRTWAILEEVAAAARALVNARQEYLAARMNGVVLEALGKIEEGLKDLEAVKSVGT